MFFPSKYFKSLLIVNAFAFNFLFTTNLATAQNIPVPDNTLGSENSRVESLGQIDAITGGATRGLNLFHSFREFNVDVGRGVYFFAPNAGIQNILARVTGGNRSEILGTLGTRVFDGISISNSNANLFLINPNGIVFGEGARLDVGGSFVATTANAVQFGEQGVFSATNPEVPQLLRVNPSAFLFNQINNQAGIQNNSVAPAGQNPIGRNVLGLRVPDGKSLLLLGGNVNMDGGQLNAFGGNVELGGLAAPGNINLVVEGDNLRLGFPENGTRADVSLANQAGVYVTNIAGGGNLVINAVNIDILNRSILDSGSLTFFGEENSNIYLKAERDISLQNSQLQGGDIEITGSSLFLKDGSAIQTTNLLSGRRGNIKINVTDRVLLTGYSPVTSFSSQISTNVFSLGETEQNQGGDIDIIANSIVLEQAAFIATGNPGNGNTGNISLQANDTIFLRDGSNLRTITIMKGNAGDIWLRSGKSIVLQGSYIFSSTFSNGATEVTGDAGNINIQVGVDSTDNVGQANLTLTDNSSLNSSTYGNGNAGNTSIKVNGAITIDNNSRIFSFLETGATQGKKGGNIDIRAQSLSLKSSFLSTTTYAEGNAGNINIETDEFVSLTNSGSISSSIDVTGKGKAGDIEIQTGSLLLNNQTTIDNSIYGSGEGGKISIHAVDNIKLNESSSINSSIYPGGIGEAGKIELHGRNLTLQGGSQVLAIIFREDNTLNLPGGNGKGGNILVNISDLVKLSGTNPIGYSSGLLTITERGAKGQAGSITITSNNLQVEEGAVINSQTLNLSDGGKITINSNNLEVIKGGQILSSTRSEGKAGDININTTNNIYISGHDPNFFQRFAQFGRDIVSNEGSNSGVFANTDGQSTGNGGILTLNANNIYLADGGQISAQSQGIGRAGDVIINTQQNFNANNGLIVTAAQQGGGGNIDIKAKNIRLRNNSDIRTDLSTGQGSGGNIALSASTIIALEDSDIGKKTNDGICSGGGFGCASIPNLYLE